MSGPKRILCSQLPQPHHAAPLEEVEATHAVRVLRLKDGDVVEAMDGSGHASLATLRTRNGPPRLEFIESESEGARVKASPQLVPVTLEMAVLKGEAMEWVVEKAVELGVTSLAPMLTAHTIVQMDRKGPEAFRERWQKIADQALKQCGRLERLVVRTPTSLDAIITQPLGPHAARIRLDESAKDESPFLLQWLETSRSKGFSPLHLLVGPEGGWSVQERELLQREMGQNEKSKESRFVVTSLGPLILRAETAAISAMGLLAADLRLRDRVTS